LFEIQNNTIFHAYFTISDLLSGVENKASSQIVAASFDANINHLANGMRWKKSSNSNDKLNETKTSSSSSTKYSSFAIVINYLTLETASLLRMLSPSVEEGRAAEANSIST